MLFDAEHRSTSNDRELFELFRSRKYDRSSIEIIYRYRQSFQQKRNASNPADLRNLVVRTYLATELSIRIVYELKKINDVKDWPYSAG